MKIPTHWARRDFTVTDADGRRLTRSALGWSFEDRDDAERMAAERAERAVRAHAAGGPLDDGYYAGMPLREPVVQSVDVGGECVGVITRNRYGCRVLNAERVMFADIDLTPPRPDPRAGLWRRLLDWFRPGGSDAPTPPSTPLQQQAIDDVKAFCAQRAGTALRVYRTYAGLRLLFTDRQYDAADPATLDVLLGLKSDPLFVQLTKRQDCFRARLSAKPWRIGVRVPGHASLIDHPVYPDQLAAWAVSYEVTAAAYATCRLVGTIGPAADDPVIRRVVAVHDQHALADAKPLA